MSPQKSLRYFRPMEHIPLVKIDNIMRLNKPITDYFIYTKPIGVDVYIVNGKIYDFNHNEILNRELLFNLGKVLMSSIQIQGLYIGTLSTLTDPLKVIKHKLLFYQTESILPERIHFFVYDVIFPYFKSDNPFWCRNDIAKKTIGNLPHCTCLGLIELNNFNEFEGLIKQRFNINRHSSFIIFDKRGNYHSGQRQLSFCPHEQVSFELSASQKYRSHIKKIHSIKIELPNGNVVRIAESIDARFKNKIINIPVTSQNFILKRNLWEHRKELKRMPFVFEGIYFNPLNSNEFEILGIHYSKFIL